MLRRAQVLAVSMGLVGCADADATPGGTESHDSSSSTLAPESMDGGSGSVVSSSESSSGGTTTEGDGGESTTGDASSSADESSSSGGSGVPGARCGPLPACDDAPPPSQPILEWNHFESILVTASGSPNHRGRDMFYLPDDDHWLVAKFSYGLTDWDLEDEIVDVHLQRGCEGAWEFLGSVSTTFEGDHPAVEGVSDSGGRVYLLLPPEDRLGPGRHRVHFVVRGDDTRTEAFIEVVPPDAPLFVTDVDGTLTTSENEEFTALLLGNIPDVHPDAPLALTILADKGYHPMYLTARPEFLVGRTRELVATHGLPSGIVHTTLVVTGATGASAAAFKTEELARLAARSLRPTFVFGNTETDAEAYDNHDIQPLERRVFFQFDDPFGGRRIESYTELIDELEALPSLCEP